MEIIQHNTSDIAESLMKFCWEEGVFCCAEGDISRQDDILESGAVDSMGVVYMQAVIQEKYGIELATELFVTELRSVQAIAAYMAKIMANRRAEKLMAA